MTSRPEKIFDCCEIASNSSEFIYCQKRITTSTNLLRRRAGHLTHLISRFTIMVSSIILPHQQRISPSTTRFNSQITFRSGSTELFHLLILLLIIGLSTQTPVPSDSSEESVASVNPIEQSEIGNFPMKISNENADKSTSSESPSANSSSTLRFSPDECPVYKNQALHAVMDRVCEICHDMFSHQYANMRVDCRQNCFRTESFKKCLYLFKPAKESKKRRSSRHIRPHLFKSIL